MSLISRWIAPVHRPPMAGLPFLHAGIASLAAGLTIAATALLTRQAVAPGGTFLVASMGATAFLAFLMPHSPLAQPWPIMGGQILSAVVGVACSQLIPSTAGALAAGTAAALLVMLACRCLHPPGAATAVAAALAGSHGVDWSFPLVPVAMNAGLIVASAWTLHRLLPHHPPAAAPGPAGRPATLAPYSDEDLDAALAQMPEALDITREDLMEILRLADAARNGRKPA